MNIAIHGTAAGLKIVIEDVESMDYCGDRVVWRWSNERRLRRSWAREIKGKPCFRVNRQWTPLDECKRADHARVIEACSK